MCTCCCFYPAGFPSPGSGGGEEGTQPRWQSPVLCPLWFVQGWVCVTQGGPISVLSVGFTFSVLPSVFQCFTWRYWGKVLVSLLEASWPSGSPWLPEAMSPLPGESRLYKNPPNCERLKGQRENTSGPQVSPEDGPLPAISPGVLWVDRILFSPHKLIWVQFLSFATQMFWWIWNKHEVPRMWELARA